MVDCQRKELEIPLFICLCTKEMDSSIFVMQKFHLFRLRNRRQLKQVTKAGLWFSNYGLQFVVFVWDGADITLASHAAAEFLPCPG